jgi:hypothetical protein
MTEPIIATEEIKELLKAAYASAIEAQNLRREYLLLPLKERYEIMLAERDALRALAVQPWKHIEPRDSFEIEWTILP